jgi:hypothetical protein
MSSSTSRSTYSSLGGRKAFSDIVEGQQLSTSPPGMPEQGSPFLLLIKLGGGGGPSPHKRGSTLAFSHTQGKPSYHFHTRSGHTPCASVLEGAYDDVARFSQEKKRKGEGIVSCPSLAPSLAIATIICSDS